MLAEWQAIELIKGGKAGGKGINECYTKVAEFKVFFGRSEFFFVLQFLAFAFVFFFLYRMSGFERGFCVMLFVRSSLYERGNIRQCFYRIEARHVLLHTGMQMVVPLYQEETQ